MNFKEILEGKTFYDKDSRVRYNFSNDTFKVNGQMVAKCKLYEKDGKIFLETDPQLGDDKTMRIDIDKANYPMSLSIIFASNSKVFATLVEE